ncbi:MAG: 4'-phosphopantetheinyl transferase superfamily protein [Alistipes sp.]|nr:4'-phosphopantetheinyl transferase superfamily protein [Alistipes sp.]
MNNRLVAEPLPPLDELLGAAHPADEALCRGYTERRRREFLAWRAIVRRELGRDAILTYAPNGRPQVEGGPYISIAHSREMVVVRFSDAPCAVDTEPLDRNFDRAKSRYMTSEEEHLSDDRRLPAAVWCAKETLYKLSDGSGADLLRDFTVSEVDFAEGRIVGSIRGGAPVTLGIEFLDGNIIVFA